MMNQGENRAKVGLEALGIKDAKTIYWNLGTPALTEQAVIRGEGLLARLGPLVVRTGQYTGCSAQDKFVVRDAESENKVW